MSRFSTGHQKQQRTIDAQVMELTRVAAELARQNAELASLVQDRQAQMARIDALERQVAEVARLKQLVAQILHLQIVQAD